MTDNSPTCYLAIDTSTTRGAVALVTADQGEVRILAEREFLTNRSHNSALFTPAGELIAELNGQPLEAIIVGTGPGSYTGIRIGIAAANGLAVALNTRVIGIPSILGLSPESNDYLAIGDARRGNGFHWAVRDGVPQDDAVICTNNKLRYTIADSSLPAFTLETLPEEFQLDPQKIRLPLLVSRYLDSPRSFESETSVEPVYLAAPFVTTPKNL